MQLESNQSISSGEIDRLFSYLKPTLQKKHVDLGVNPINVFSMPKPKLPETIRAPWAFVTIYNVLFLLLIM